MSAVFNPVIAFDNHIVLQIFSYTVQSIVYELSDFLSTTHFALSHISGRISRTCPFKNDFKSNLYRFIKFNLY